MKNRVLRYNYTWGTEDVPRSSITVTQTGEDQYELLFEQEGPIGTREHFRNIHTPYFVDSQDEMECVRHDKGIEQKRVRLDVIAKFNPKPEDLFVID